MRTFLLILLISSCSSFKGKKWGTEPAPSWIEGVRNGHESLKVSYGSKMLYRRIASSEKGDEHACEIAITKAEEDVKREFPLFPTIPYTLEVLFYDKNYEDCAVTISVNSSLLLRYEQLKHIAGDYKKREFELENSLKTVRSERKELAQKYDELQSYLRRNAHLLSKVNTLESNVDRIKSLILNNQNKAEKYAFTGLAFYQFQHYMKEHVERPNSYGAFKELCWKNFRHLGSTDHGSITICWSINSIILGFCNTREGQCYTKYP